MATAVIVTGARDWFTAELVIDRQLAKLPKGSFVIHGDAPGVDSTAGGLAKMRGMVEVKVPYIKKLGRAGGPARNGYMLRLLLGLEKMGYDIKVLAFHPDLARSRGTKDMVTKAERKGVKVDKFKK